MRCDRNPEAQKAATNLLLLDDSREGRKEPGRIGKPHAQTIIKIDHFLRAFEQARNEILPTLLKFLRGQAAMDVRCRRHNANYRTEVGQNTSIRL